MNEAKYLKNSIYIIIFFALAGISLIIFMTSKFGPAVSEDSISYLAAARNIINGRGISILLDSEGNQLNLWLPWVDGELYHMFPWPPLYPFIISIFGFAGLNSVDSARFINAVLFGANITLILLIIRKYTRSLAVIIFSAIIFITSIYMLQVHYAVWSEPLFLFFSLTGFYFLFYFLENNKLYNFIISSLSFSLAFFTRTLGISLIAAGAVAILLFYKSKVGKRIIYSLVFTVIGLLPSLVWNLKNKFIFGYTTPELLIHPLKLDVLRKIIETVSSWFYLNLLPAIPGNVSIIILSVILIAIISVSIYVYIKSRKKNINTSYQNSSSVINIFLIFVFFYMFSLLAAGILFIANINIDGRILIPVFIPSFIIIVLLVIRLLDYFKNKKNIKLIIIALSEIFILLSLVAAVFTVRDAYKEGSGFGYNSREWLESDTVNELKGMDMTETIYTNNPYAVYFFLDKNPAPLPAKLNIYTDKDNTDYPEDLDRTIEEIREENSLIVFFDSGQYYLTGEEELLENYKLILIKDTRDGAIYTVK